MALNIFKKKSEKGKEKPLVAQKQEEKKEKVQKEKETEPVFKKQRKAVPEEAYRILKTPHIAEKASILSEKNQYVFNVYTGANKTEIRKAVEDVYGVDVEFVNIIKVPAKRRRRGKQVGLKKGYKKAVVKVKDGQKIEIMPR